jgi:hypothetical protein
MEKKSKNKKALPLNNTQINESLLFTHISKIIKKRKYRAGMYANREVTLMYWEISYYIYNEITYITILAGESQQCQKASIGQITAIKS